MNLIKTFKNREGEYRHIVHTPVPRGYSILKPILKTDESVLSIEDRFHYSHYAEETLRDDGFTEETLRDDGFTEETLRDDGFTEETLRYE